MNIYFINRTDDWGYDEYDSCVVIAPNREKAIFIACEGCGFYENKLEVERIGIADDDQKEGIVLSSFNAG